MRSQSPTDIASASLRRSARRRLANSRLLFRAATGLTVVFRHHFARAVEGISAEDPGARVKIDDAWALLRSGGRFIGNYARTRSGG